MNPYVPTESRLLPYILIIIFWPRILLRLKELVTWSLRTFLNILKGAGSRMRGQAAPSIRIGSITLSDQERLRHSHIVGATGSGKTGLLEHLIVRDIERGQGALIIDPKGDRELFERVRFYSKRAGRLGDLKLLSATHLQESSSWNPCRLGNASELQSKFFNSATYDEPYYAKACELGLLIAFNGLLSSPSDGFCLSDLSNELEELAASDKSNSTQGLFYDLKNLSEGEWGPVLRSARGKYVLPEISLFDAVRRNEIVFVDLPTEAKATQSSRIGKLLLQEIMLISGMRKLYPAMRGDRPFSVYIDEFDAFASQSFATFLNKGRSSSFMIHIAHQTLSDLERVSKTFMGQIMGNCDVRFIFRQDDPDDAERWSRFLGTRTVVKSTYQTENGLKTGRSSNREVQEFRVSPDAIKELGTGECIFSTKTGRQLRKVQIPAPETLRRTDLALPEQRPEKVEPRKPATLDAVDDRYALLLGNQDSVQEQL